MLSIACRSTSNRDYQAKGRQQANRQQTCDKQADAGRHIEPAKGGEQRGAAGRRGEQRAQSKLLSRRFGHRQSLNLSNASTISLRRFSNTANRARMASPTAMPVLQKTQVCPRSHEAW